MSHSHLTQTTVTRSGRSSKVDALGVLEECEYLIPRKLETGARNSSGWWCGRRLFTISVACLAGVWALGACSLDGLLKSNDLPPNVTDPAITQTPAGAGMAYRGALLKWQQSFGSGSGDYTFIGVTGLLSDELFYSASNSFAPDPVDLRVLPEGASNGGTDAVFGTLNNVRQRARQARGLVGDYLPAEPALKAHLYAVEGYTEVLLAELFCSGIPLSTVDYRGDYTLRPGSSTAEVFTHARALFDSALALAGDSARILNLSRVGQARALLGLSDYAAAAAAVAQVPDTFRYTLRYTSSGQNVDLGLGYYAPGAGGGYGVWGNVGVADREGTNGLDYRSSGDPRTQDSLLDNGHYHPQKYHVTGADTVVLASGIEARLIEAEAALQANPNDGIWLAKLNALRTDGTQDGGGTYNPGSGGVAGLTPLTDPGSDSARVSLLFRERAFWLFLTGHRQGDMRRLVRQYHRPQEAVYPVGPGPYGAVYGPYIDAPIPPQEQVVNPLFTGCQSRD